MIMSYDTLMTLGLVVALSGVYMLYGRQVQIIKKLRSLTPTTPTREQALTALHAIASGANDTREQYQDFETIRDALYRLPPDA